MRFFPLAVVASAGITFGQPGNLVETPPASSQQAPAAQQPEAAPPSRSQDDSQAQKASNKGGSSFLGQSVPFFDAGSEVITWDGKSWNINNNRVFEARFEKYLSAPADTSEADEEYNAVLQKIIDLLAPGRVSQQSVDEAFKLLAKASEFQTDANLCDAIADQVYSAWLAVQARSRLVTADRSLEDERKRLEWNAQLAAEESKLGGTTSRRGDGAAQAAGEVSKQIQLQRDLEMQPILQRLAEVNALMKANQVKREVNELQAKIEFQALLVQHFLQRRFRHVLIGTRFYRAIFNEGDTQLRVGEDAKNLFAKTTGMPPTVSTLDSMANEIIRDVREGVDSFKYLLEKNELESATKRLAETFVIGEYLPPIRTLNRDDKRRTLAFLQKSNQLLSAIEVRDYALAEKLVKDLQESAKDFDVSKPMAAVETAKTIAAMHLAKARNAAVSGDHRTLEAELKQATEIWPRNPALADVSSMIFNQSDVHQRALLDLEQLISQKNHRRIMEDQARFIAATAMYPDRADQLREVLENMGRIEQAIIRAQEIEKRGDYPGAWESVEFAYRDFPNDTRLNQVRAELTTKAADYVRLLRRAEELEQRDQPGAGLAWYLKAQNEYPPSDFAREGINRLVKTILPDAK